MVGRKIDGRVLLRTILNEGRLFQHLYKRVLGMGYSSYLLGTSNTT